MNLIHKHTLQHILFLGDAEISTTTHVKQIELSVPLLILILQSEDELRLPKQLKLHTTYNTHHEVVSKYNNLQYLLPNHK